ncbi:hypothetical protein CRG98_049544, partial [Punica granatum]
GEELNGNGELYIKKHRKLRIKLVDGSSLAVAIVLKSIPKGTSQVLLCGKLNKVASALAKALCQSGVQVCAANENDLEKLKESVDSKFGRNLVHSTSYSPK